MNNLTFNYFKSLLKRQNKLLILYFVVCFVSYPLVLFLNGFDEHAVAFGNLIYSIYMLALAFVLPFIAFRFSFSKKQVDTVYSLPIKRKHLFDAHYFSSIAIILIIPFINFLIGLILSSLSSGLYFTLIPGMLLCYLASCLVAILAYSFNSWLVNISNNNVDALIMIASYLVIPFIIYLAWDTFASNQAIGLYAPDLFNWLKYVSPISQLAFVFDYVDQYRDFYRFDTQFYFNLIYVVIGVIVFYYLASRTFCKRKGEDSEQNTTHRFTYPLVINVLSFCFISLFNITEVSWTGFIIYLVISFVIFAIMEFVRRRSTKITPQLIIKYVVLLLAFNLFNFAAKQTYFFGLNHRVIKPEQYDRIMIRLYSDDKDENRVLEIKEVRKMSPTSKVVVDEVIKLQALAAEKFKAGTYYDYANNQNSEMVHIQVVCLVKESDGIHIGQSAYYEFTKSEIPEIYNSPALIIEEPISTEPTY